MKPYYDEDGITIYHGDAREVLPELEPEYFDLLLTDPPYGMGFAGKGVTTARANVRADGVRQGVRVVRQVLFEAARVLRADAHLYLFCHWESWPDFYDAVSPLASPKSALVWWKDRGGMGDTELEYARDYEVILFAANGRRALAGRRDGAVLEGFPPVPSPQRVHPTEKPVPLCTYLVSKSAPPGGAVLDPFMGSGPTLRAAKDLGLRAVGIEIEERHCETAAKRLAQGVLQLIGGAP